MSDSVTRRALMTGTALAAAGLAAAQTAEAEAVPETEPDQPQLLDTPHVRAYYARARS